MVNFLKWTAAHVALRYSNGHVRVDERWYLLGPSKGSVWEVKRDEVRKGWLGIVHVAPLTGLDTCCREEEKREEIFKKYKGRRSGSRRRVAKKKSPYFQSIEEVTLYKMVSGSYGSLDSRSKREQGRGDTENSEPYHRHSSVLWLGWYMWKDKPYFSLKFSVRIFFERSRLRGIAADSEGPRPLVRGRRSDTMELIHIEGSGVRVNFLIFSRLKYVFSFHLTLKETCRNN